MCQAISQVCKRKQTNKHRTAGRFSIRSERLRPWGVALTGTNPARSPPPRNIRSSVLGCSVPLLSQCHAGQLSNASLSPLGFSKEAKTPRPPSLRGYRIRPLATATVRCSSGCTCVEGVCIDGEGMGESLPREIGALITAVAHDLGAKSNEDPRPMVVERAFLIL